MTLWIKPPAPASLLVVRAAVSLGAVVVGFSNIVLSMVLQEFARCVRDADGYCNSLTGWSWSIWWTLVPIVVGVLCAIAALVMAFRSNTAGRALAGLIFLAIGVVVAICFFAWSVLDQLSYVRI